jgi:carbohydrate-selective porin OprB
MHSTAILLAVLLFTASAWALEDKKTDDLKPAYIGEALGNPSGGLKRGSVYEGRLNLAVDVEFEKLAGMRALTFHANMF